jgi:hypothetical protein
VHQRIRAQGDQGIHIVSGGEAERLGQPADLTDVAAHLVRVAHTHADQFEQRVPDDLGDHHPADKARAPDHDPLRFRDHASPAAFRSDRAVEFTIGG